ncbi:molybdopterin binding oxidoreductase [Acephala macrosclerotiorum]|nr:molybdopterin binding oxidoreductase [Acephala macrosclerotiorum]
MKIRVAMSEKSEYQKLREKCSPREIALRRSLQHGKDYIYNLKQNDSEPLNLVRLTRKHTLNGEPKLQPLFEAGRITPNEFLYVQNCGAVPYLLWEVHKFEVQGLKPDQKLELTMDQFGKRFNTVNITVTLACDGKRRKERDMIKRSKGFNWGSGAVSCAYWKGPLPRDLLSAAGLPGKLDEGRRL